MKSILNRNFSNFMYHQMATLNNLCVIYYINNLNLAQNTCILEKNYEYTSKIK